MTDLAIEAAILCEDVRQEKSNKFMLIGVYVGDIFAKQLPMNVPLAVFVTGTPSEDKGEFWLRFSGPGKGSATMKLGYERTGESPAISLATPVLDVLLEQEGTILIERSFDGENWATLFERKIIQKEEIWSLTTIASPPPSELSQADAPETSSQP
jgi:hypothetical protein